MDLEWLLSDLFVKQNIHKELENKISKFLEKEDTILYAAAFDANGGLFEPLANKEDAIISDELIMHQ